MWVAARHKNIINEMAESNSFRIDLESAANVHANTGHGDAFEQPLSLETPSQSKIEVNALKNEILIDGMQVSTTPVCRMVIAIPIHKSVSYMTCAKKKSACMPACQRLHPAMH